MKKAAAFLGFHYLIACLIESQAVGIFRCSSVNAFRIYLASLLPFQPGIGLIQRRHCRFTAPDKIHSICFIGVALFEHQTWHILIFAVD